MALKTAIYWGCRIATTQYAYELSLRAVLTELDVELVDIEGASCCGDPIKSVNLFPATYLAARNLALVKEHGLDTLLVPCNRCHLTFSELQYGLSRKKLRDRIDAILVEEGLRYEDGIKLRHVIDLLHDVIGPDNIRTKITQPINGLKLAAHPGCMLIRPSELGRVDDAERPEKLDALIAALGAEVIEYPEKLDCCGGSLSFSHADAALTFTGEKLKALQERGVDALADSCPACHTMFDAKQASASQTIGSELHLPVFYYTQLLGLAMGIDAAKLGLQLNQSAVGEFVGKIGH